MNRDRNIFLRGSNESIHHQVLSLMRLARRLHPSMSLPATKTLTFCEGGKVVIPMQRSESILMLGYLNSKEFLAGVWDLLVRSEIKSNNLKIQDARNEQGMAKSTSNSACRLGSPPTSETISVANNIAGHSNWASGHIGLLRCVFYFDIGEVQIKQFEFTRRKWQRAQAIRVANSGLHQHRKPFALRTILPAARAEHLAISACCGACCLIWRWGGSNQTRWITRRNHFKTTI